jgi:hypothetical protein
VTVSVEELLASFPEPGGDFVLSSQMWPVRELRALLGVEVEIVLSRCDPDPDHLTVAGTVDTPAGPVDVTLRFTAAGDGPQDEVVGLGARLPVGRDVADLAELWGLDLHEVPAVFLGEVSEISAFYELPDATAVFLAETGHLRVVFGRGDADSRLSVQVGLKDVNGSLPDLPFVGDLIPDGDRYRLRGAGVIVVRDPVTPTQAAALNSAVGNAVGDPSVWWPALPSGGLDQDGVWLAACCVVRDSEYVWAVRLGVPDVSWLPDFSEVPIDVGAFRLTWSRFGLRPLPGFGGLEVIFDLSLDLGGLRLRLPDAGFVFDFSLEVGSPVFVVASLPALSLELLGHPLRFEIPSADWDPSLPGFPGLPGPGVLTGWWDGLANLGSLADLLGLFGVSVPSLPGVFNPALPALGLRFDWGIGDIQLIGETGWLRFVCGALPDLSDLGAGWAKFGLIGIKGLRALLNDLPFIGSLVPVLPDFLLDGISFSVIGVELPRASFDRLTGWLGTLPDLPAGGWWPSLSWEYSGGTFGMPGFSLDVNWKIRDRPALDWGISWPSMDLPDIAWPPVPEPPELPDIPWLDLDLELGPLHLHKIGLTWPGLEEIDWSPPDGPSWVLRVVFDVSFDLRGGFSFALPGLGFDFDLKTLSPASVHPRLPKISFTLADFGTVELTVPMPTAPRPEWPRSITASWSDPEGVSAADIAGFFGLDVLGEAIPDFLMPRLYSVGLFLDFSSFFLVITGAGGIGGWLNCAWLFATQAANENATNRRKLVGLRSVQELKASDLPPNIGAAEVRYHFDIVMSGVHLVYAEQHWPLRAVEDLNRVLAQLDPPALVTLPTILPMELPKGFQAWGDLRVGDLLEVVLIYPDRDLPAVRGGPVGSNADLLGYTIGAMRFSRVRLGLGYGLLYLAFDATLAIGSLTVDLIGLGIGLDKDLDARPVLEGAAVAYELAGTGGDSPLPRISIEGALVHLDLGPEFDFAMVGAGLIEVEGLVGLFLAGSWARNTAGWTSLFAYAEVNSAQSRIEGLFSIPPVTFTGIALGFGINSTVRVPTAADISRFPLIKQLGRPSEPLTPGQALTELAGTGGWITPAQGQYWIAGGAEFSVYSFIRARVLVLVEWGQAGWKVMFAGSTTLLLPPVDVYDFETGQPIPVSGFKKLGEVTVDFAFVYDSALSRFSMDSVIAKGSYILDPAAALTGGISLYVWGKNLPARGISKGFVLTAGGYHPQFTRTKPRYYPEPPRIGWLWERGPITFTGQAYAALTDGAFMIGAAVAAVYESKHSGIAVRAWFTAHLDALVQWKPFYADLAIGLSIGVSATVKVAFIRVKVSLEIGVELQLWLPPIGGRATVKVWFVSFTFNIGAARQGAPPVPWEDFQIQLPAPTRSALKNGGQLKDVDPDIARRRAEDGDPQLVRIDGFSVAVESALPASKITIGGELFAGSEDARIDIRPMRLTGVVSEQEIHLCGPDGLSRDVEYWKELGWEFQATTEGMPKALWGRPLANPNQALNDTSLVPECLTGVTITVPAPKAVGSLEPVPAENLTVEPNWPEGFMPLVDTSVAGPAPDPTEDSIEVIRTTLTETAAERRAVHRVLAHLGKVPHSDGPLDQYADLVGRTMADFPYLTATSVR